MQLLSMGDKPYKCPDYSKNFFININAKSLDQHIIEKRI